ncbi:trimethylamine methyltransferase family protein [Marispirochaeta sp.]|uniref:trimethylamine methyltransferase family protein n=1 Tax=Marispirochaeta sp. TaxID=2038653 RepID=UPI0029C8C8B5|nr:trimethylamine methyltransferase family protein [Marispirochaeta sp.]
MKRHQYKPLSEAEIQRIDQATMKVLSSTGFEVHEDEAFELFSRVAESVDTEKRIVRLSEKRIREIISSAPGELTLFSRDGKNDCRLGSGEVYFGTGGTALNMLDYPEGLCRPAVLKDLENIARVVDKMDNVHLFLLPTYPNETPIDKVDISRFYTGLKFTAKHVMGGVYTGEGINSVIRMAEELAGGKDQLRKRPFLSMITCGISPLRLDSKYGRFMMQIAKEGIPLAVPAEPLCGATSPMSLAGTLVIQNCDALINVMLTQLVNPGTPVIYGCVSTSTDQRNLGYLGGPVESGMINAATAQMTQYYGIPYYATAGISDSKTLDAQCGYESAINNLLVGMAGADFIHDAAGLMEFAMTVSLEKLVIDNEILGYAKRAIRGIEVNDETLALKDIQKIGPGGNFLTSRHTRKFMRKEHYAPTLSNRDQRSQWEAGGRVSVDERAHEIVKSILEGEAEIYLKDSVFKEKIVV